MRKLLAQLGDKDPITHGGYFIFDSDEGDYPQGEWLESPEEDDHQVWRVYRFDIVKCTYQSGILSDNPYHPAHPAWFANQLSSLCGFVEIEEDDLVEMFCGEDVLERAEGYRVVGSYHGFENLDEYPLELTRDEVEERYVDKQEGHV